jgi:murein DD-endopeptidase MepM/ murein hydrolase activator NlpD
MSNNKIAEYLQLAIAAARAAYGDFSGLVAQGIKYLPRIIAILAAVVIIVVLLPVLFIWSLFTGDSTTPSGTFSEIAVGSMQYKDDWIIVMAIAQTRKGFNGSDKADLQGAYQAMKDNKIREYLEVDPNTSGDIMDVYNRNLELMKNTLSGYAGNEYYYDEIIASSSWQSIQKTFNAAKGYNILEATVKTNDGESSEVIYSTHDVVNFKEEAGVIKIKYQKYSLKAYFPIAKEYTANFSDDFGAGRTHDGDTASHEGNDIFADRNTPILAIEDCTIEKIGWNSLGGWRILLKSSDGDRKYYYAHMENYADNLQNFKDMSGKVVDNPGIEINVGEVIGYVGSSGSFISNTLPGADTGTAPHIHLQMWVVSKGWFSDKETLIDPYYCLKLLEMNKYGEDVRMNKEKLDKEGL